MHSQQEDYQGQGTAMYGRPTYGRAASRAARRNSTIPGVPMRSPQHPETYNLYTSPVSESYDVSPPVLSSPEFVYTQEQNFYDDEIVANFSDEADDSYGNLWTHHTHATDPDFHTRGHHDLRFEGHPEFSHATPSMASHHSHGLDLSANHWQAQHIGHHGGQMYGGQGHFAMNNDLPEDARDILVRSRGDSGHREVFLRGQRIQALLNQMNQGLENRLVTSARVMTSQARSMTSPRVDFRGSVRGRLGRVHPHLGRVHPHMGRIHPYTGRVHPSSEGWSSQTRGEVRERWTEGREREVEARRQRAWMDGARDGEEDQTTANWQTPVRPPSVRYQATHYRQPRHRGHNRWWTRPNSRYRWARGQRHHHHHYHQQQQQQQQQQAEHGEDFWEASVAAPIDMTEYQNHEQREVQREERVNHEDNRDPREVQPTARRRNRRRPAFQHRNDQLHRALDAIRKLPASDSGTADTPCTICLEGFSQSEQVSQLPCSHVFHPPCIQTWLHRKLTCPLCRQCLLDSGGRSQRGQGN